jgi:hypothetical protein
MGNGERLIRQAVFWLLLLLIHHRLGWRNTELAIVLNECWRIVVFIFATTLIATGLIRIVR